MRLCDTDIEKYLDDGLITLTPRPSNDKINGATIDVRLGNSFRVFREYSAPYIDVSGPREELSAQLERVMSDEIIIGDNEAFFLHPGVAGRTFVFSAFRFDGACNSPPYRPRLGRQNRVGILQFG